jgi:hypothetical protein
MIGCISRKAGVTARGPPDKDLRLRTVAGEAHVLQDELQDTYMQLMTE